MTSSSDQLLTTPDGDEKDITQENSELKHRSSKKDLLEIDRFTICGNRIDWIPELRVPKTQSRDPRGGAPPDGQMLKTALKYLFKNLTYWWKANLSVLLPVAWSGWRSGHMGQPAATSSLEPLDRWMAQERSLLLGEAAESPWAPQERPHHPLPSTPLHQPVLPEDRTPPRVLLGVGMRWRRWSSYMTLRFQPHSVPTVFKLHLPKH